MATAQIVQTVPLEGLLYGPAETCMAEPCSSKSVYDLIVAAQAGDWEALNDFLIRIQAPVLGFLRRRLNDPGLERFVEDVMSEVLVRVYRRHRQCNADSDRSVMAWVLTIAHNEALRLIERHPIRYGILLGARDPSEIGVRKPGQGQPFPRPETYYSSAEAPRSEGLEAVLAVVMRIETEMEPDLAQIFYLRLVEDRAWGEIASVLQITKGATKRRFQRAQQALATRVMDALRELPDQQRSAAERFLKRAAVK